MLKRNLTFLEKLRIFPDIAKKITIDVKLKIKHLKDPKYSNTKMTVASKLNKILINKISTIYLHKVMTSKFINE